MAVFLTILSGVIVFVTGQLILKLLIDPVQEFKKTVADVAMALIEYANIYANPGIVDREIAKKASQELRKLSSRLNTQIYLVPSYQIVAKVFRLPSKEKILKSSKNLIGLSNGVLQSGTGSDLPLANCKKADAVRDLLGIFVPEDERTEAKE